MSKEVAEAFNIRCNGMSSVLHTSTVEASITVYSDGTRDVGCPAIGISGDKRGRCQHPAARMHGDLFNCTHLHPQSQS